MKSTGIVRKIDGLGRIVLPIELRKYMDINTGDDIEIFVENGTIVVSKYTPACLFCGGREGIAEYHEKNICRACRQKIAKVK